LIKANRSAGRRLSVITLDQALSGGSNVLITVVAARTLGIDSFGLFGIVFILYVTALGLCRALVSEPLLIQPAAAEARSNDVIGSAAVVGTAAGGVIALVGLGALLWEDQLVGPLLILAVCMPLLVVQDVGRYLGFAAARPTQSVLLDSVWLFLVVAASSLLLVFDVWSLGWLVSAWGMSGALAGGLALWMRRTPVLRLSLRWLRESWDYSWRYTLSFASTQGAAVLTTFGLFIIVSPAGLAAVRGAMLLTSPMLTMQAASVAAGIAEVARHADRPAAVSSHVRRTTLVTCCAAALVLAVLLVMPDWAGRLVLGDTWNVTTPLLLPVGVHLLLLGTVSGPRAGLLGTAQVRRAVPLDVFATVSVLAAVIVGAEVSGAPGAMWGRSLVWVLIAALWWTAYVVFVPRRHPRRATDHPNLTVAQERSDQAGPHATT
jgi:O-antigen/teichoic acid export membrane protein